MCQRSQQWDDAIDAVKRDIIDLADKFMGSALFEGLSKAYNLSLAAAEVSTGAGLRKNISVLHIIDDLTLKRLYRILSAHNQLAGYSYEVVYWIPSIVRSEVELRNIKILHELLPVNAITILDLNDFTDSERIVIGSSNCSGNLCFDLLAGKVHKLHMLQNNDTNIIQMTNEFAYWLLDIDMSWFGDLAAVLEGLIPPSTYSFPFSSLLSGDEENVKSFDFLGACSGINWMNSSMKSPIDIVYDKVRNDFNKLSTDISQVIIDTVEVITVQLCGNDSQNSRLKPERDMAPVSSPHSYCWPEVSKFSGRFLDALYMRTFGLKIERTLNNKGDDYLLLVKENNFTYHSFLELGLKEELLGKDFYLTETIVKNDEDNIKTNENENENDNVNENTNEDENEKINVVRLDMTNLYFFEKEIYSVSENEFDLLKKQFLEEQNEPFIFDWKAGTLFRKVD